jgi:hypothetical protein
MPATLQALPATALPVKRDLMVTLPSQTFGKARRATDPPVDADLEFAVVMHTI